MPKLLKSVKPLVALPRGKRPQHCVSCAALATQEALFDVGGKVSAVEKYCDACVRKITTPARGDRRG